MSKASVGHRCLTEQQKGCLGPQCMNTIELKWELFDMADESGLMTLDQSIL